MANITEILGTDSVSSSRPTINSNFELLNDELGSVVALLNPTTSVLQGLSSAATQSLTVNNAGNLFVASNAGIVASTSADFNNNVKFGARIAKSGVAGTAAVPAANLSPSEITKGTYFINGQFTLPNSVDGTEVTLINVAGASVNVVGQAADSLAIGGTTLALNNSNSTVTLRCFENKWYIVGAYAYTVS